MCVCVCVCVCVGGGGGGDGEGVDSKIRLPVLQPLEITGPVFTQVREWEGGKMQYMYLTFSELN